MRGGAVMRYVVSCLAILVVSATCVVGCGSQSPLRPTSPSNQPIASGSAFGTMLSGGALSGSGVDLATCLRPAPAANCISPGPQALRTAAALSAPGAPINLV